MDVGDELQFRFSRSSGKGGQHVNKVSTQVELRFHVASSQFLSESEKQVLLEKCQNRISADGFIILVDGSSRSQWTNKKKVTKRFYELLTESFRVVKPRIITQMPKSIKEKRRLGKQLKSEKKGSRGKLKRFDLHH